jgi:pilus assembly protein CpaB
MGRETHSWGWGAFAGSVSLVRQVRCRWEHETSERLGRRVSTDPQTEGVGVSARRTLIIIVAIAVGAVAAVGTVLYVHGAQSRANHNAKLVAIYVVAREIPKSTSGDAAISGGLIKRSSIPQQFYPSSAITDINEIKGKITPDDLAPGQVLVDNQFVEPKVANSSFSTTNIPAGQMAITISVGTTQAVAGLIVPGDKVDLMGFFKPEDAQGKPIPPADLTQYAHFFYQNVNVIAIGTSAAPTAGQTTAPTNPGSNLFTFAVPPEAAERIELAAQQNSISLALVPPDNQPVNIPAVQAGTIDGPVPSISAQPPQLTPYGQ